MTEQTITWVVYLMTIHGKTSGMNAVCEQGEWEAMERARPGYHTLVQAGIINEGEAEWLARGRQADSNTRNPSERTSSSAMSGLPATIMTRNGRLMFS
jgi:hypothetical protein